MTAAEILRGLEIVKAQDPRLRQPMRCTMQITYAGSAQPSRDRCDLAAVAVLYGEPRCRAHAETDLDAEG